MEKLSANQQTQNAREFAQYWQDKGDEKSQTHNFWIQLLRTLFGIENAETYIQFEKRVKLDHTSYIDGYIGKTKVLIEQKSQDIDLTKAARQSDGTECTPYQQAKRYNDNLKMSEKARWIVTSNFKEFRIYDMDSDEPEKTEQLVLLKDLEKEYYRLQFLTDSTNTRTQKEEEISVKAGRLVGKLYDSLIKEYKDAADPQSLRSLNILCVRIVFCLYAEDAGLFEKRTSFEDYLTSFEIAHAREGLIRLFKALDTKTAERDAYDDAIKPFPYVNGGLFSEDIEIPRFTQEIISTICSDCAAFDWHEISPTIFGSVFESTLNPETRRKGGMHYTSVQNIHKVIDSLFLDDLHQEFSTIRQIKIQKAKKSALADFQNKIAGLKFLDPACGSGNFLTETYISLRRLENDIIKEQYQDIAGGQVDMFSDLIKVSIRNFYGIEINDFAVTVAKTALWIAESQMLAETESIIRSQIEFFPLKTNAFIVEGNALKTDWQTFENTTTVLGGLFDNESTTQKRTYDYIMGNPPFVGTKYQTKEQKEDILGVSQELKMLDYVTGWYKKAADLIKGTKTECAFVSTNSITQGEQVAPLWKLLNTHINFAYRTFKWESDSNGMAQVHCVIIGFADFDRNEKIIYEKETSTTAKHINGYLLDAPDVFIESRKTPLCSEAQKMTKGSQPTDGGNLLLTEEERNELIKKNPLAEKFIKRYMGASDLINNIVRYCLWLVDASPSDLKKMPEVLKRLEKVRDSRLKSPKASTQKWADRPSLFTENRQPDSDYLILPVVSSENRQYMPVCYVTKDVIANANAQMIPNANLYTFGIINSSVHNSWMRAICGRMKSDYAYSASIVYNNFPWCSPTDAQKAKIEQTAQAILDARAMFPDSSLADLYDPLTMPPELRKAHTANDKAVLAAYGFKSTITESQIVASLMELYKGLVK